MATVAHLPAPGSAGGSVTMPVGVALRSATPRRSRGLEALRRFLSGLVEFSKNRCKGGAQGSSLAKCAAKSEMVVLILSHGMERHAVRRPGGRGPPAGLPVKVAQKQSWGDYEVSSSLRRFTVNRPSRAFQKTSFANPDFGH
jgi:hypothetical protein